MVILVTFYDRSGADIITQPKNPASETFGLFQTLADALLPVDAVFDYDVPVVRRVVVHFDDSRKLVRVHAIDDHDNHSHGDTQQP